MESDEKKSALREPTGARICAENLLEKYGAIYETEIYRPFAQKVTELEDQMLAECKRIMTGTPSERSFAIQQLARNVRLIQQVKARLKYIELGSM